MNHLLLAADDNNNTTLQHNNIMTEARRLTTMVDCVPDASANEDPVMCMARS